MKPWMYWCLAFVAVLSFNIWAWMDWSRASQDLQLAQGLYLETENLANELIALRKHNNGRMPVLARNHDFVADLRTAFREAGIHNSNTNLQSATIRRDEDSNLVLKAISNPVGVPVTVSQAVTLITKVRSLDAKYSIKSLELLPIKSRESSDVERWTAKFNFYFCEQLSD